MEKSYFEIYSLKISIIIFLFIALGGYNISNIYFYHNHIINGKIINHSHPYSKDKPHNHSKEDFIFIKHIENNFRLFLTVFFSLLFILFYLKIEYLIKIIFIKYKILLLITNPIRAPSV